MHRPMATILPIQANAKRGRCRYAMYKAIGARSLGDGTVNHCVNFCVGVAALASSDLGTVKDAGASDAAAASMQSGAKRLGPCLHGCGLTEHLVKPWAVDGKRRRSAADQIIIPRDRLWEISPADRAV